MLLLHLLSLYTLIPPEPLPQWEDDRLLNAALAASTIVFETASSTAPGLCADCVFEVLFQSHALAVQRG